MKKKKLLSFLLATAMTISLLPTFTLTVWATTNEKNITLKTAALSGYDSTDNSYKRIYFGNYDNKAIKWLILSMNGNDGTYKDSNDASVTSSNAMFLLSEFALKEMLYDNDYEPNNVMQTAVSNWRYSDIWNWCNNTFINSSFTADEKKHLLQTSKDDSTGTFKFTDGLYEDTFFLLSKNEFQDEKYFSENSAETAAINSSNYFVNWWLRTPITQGFMIDGVDEISIVDENGYLRCALCDDNTYGVRPAFNQNTEAVLFTSAADGKKKDNVGKLLENTEYTGNEYKLTLKDITRNEFTAKTTSVSKNALAISYANAKTGENEYISAIIVNDSGEVTHYGKLANTTSESGTATLDLTGVTLASTDKIYVFNEQTNGAYKTDFSSDLKEITNDTKITLKDDKVSVRTAGNNATLIVASYKDKALKDVKIIPVTSTIYEKTFAEIGLDTAVADSIKAFLWTDMKNLIPLCDEQDVSLNQNAS